MSIADRLKDIDDRIAFIDKLRKKIHLNSNDEKDDFIFLRRLVEAYRNVCKRVPLIPEGAFEKAAEAELARLEAEDGKD